VSQQPLQWMGATAQMSTHGAGQATCAMCGTELPVSLMVPDGGEACTDVRWYCRDAAACTQRWTAAQALRAAVDGEAAPGMLDDEQTGHSGRGGEQTGDDGLGGEQPGHSGRGGEQTGDDGLGGKQTGHDGADGKQAGRPVAGAPGAG
jgi:hypothetical protein